MNLDPPPDPVRAPTPPPAGADALSTLRFELAFRSSPAPMLLSDIDSGRIFDANNAALGLCGYSRPEMVGWTTEALGLFPAGVRAGLLEKLRAEGHLRNETLEILARGGRVRTCHMSAEILPDAEGPRLLTTLQDITPMVVQARQLERFTQLYACLSQVNQAIVWTRERAPLLDRICEAMVEFGKFRMAWIGWNDPATGEVAVVSRFGDATGYLQGLRVRSDDSALGQGGTGQAIRTGQPAVINDLQGAGQAAPWHARAARAGLAASASIPVRVGGQVAGALMVYAPVRDFFGEQEIALLVEMAVDLSFALDHLELARGLRESESRFRTLFEKAPLGMAILDSASGRFLSANPRLGEIFGVPPEELLAHSFLAYTHPDHRVEDQASVRELARGAVQEVQKVKRYLHRDGQVVWGRLKMVPFPGAPGEPARHLSLVEDITQAHLAQEALRETLDRLQKVAERVPGMVYQYRLRPDGTAHMPYTSPAIRAIYGLAPKDVKDDIAPLSNRYHPADHAAIVASIQASARDLTPWKMGYRILLPDGTVRHLLGDAVPEREADGGTLWTGYITDLTERRQFEAHLQQAQKMESLGNLAGGVAHDMNNVLGAILALASAKVHTLAEDHPDHKAFETIREAASRGGEVVRRLLNFARQSPREVRTVAFNDLLLEAARLLEHTTLARVRLELDLAPDLRTVQGDPSGLANVVMNLCVNAVDAMAAGGTLSLRTRNAGPGQIEVTVQDTGCGMSREVLGKAMDPFFTTKEVGKGTGLGLAMAYATVTAHQGRIELQSEPGLGTRVRLYFPAGAAPAPGPGAPDPARTDPGGAIAVLLVDDDELVRNATGVLVEVLGHTLTTATSGEEALAVLARGYRPDLVILDMNMPGLGGKGTLPALRALRPDVPILLATGRADQEAMDLVAAHPGVTLLPKPFSLSDLQRHLRRT